MFLFTSFEKNLKLKNNVNSEFPNNFAIKKIKKCCICFINKMLTCSLVAKALGCFHDVKLGSNLDKSCI